VENETTSEGCEECEEKHKVLNTLASAFKLVHDFFKDHQALPLPDEINKAAITQALAEDGYWECYHYGDYAIFGSMRRPVRASRTQHVRSAARNIAIIDERTN
jgi:hypothetical protein